MTDFVRLSRIRVRTAHPIAADSPDHLMPWGTRRDNSRNALFNEKLYRVFAHVKRPLRVLDLGCSGGGFIRDCVNDGCIAVGIEGSDYSRRMARAEWAAGDGRFLFTADMTKPFQVIAVIGDTEVPLTFDVVTAWDVMEHIASHDIEEVMKNIKRHLTPEGLVVVSISREPDQPCGVELHQTVEGRDWWVSMFAMHGLTTLPKHEAYFNPQWVRGPRQGAPYSFHLVLSMTPDQCPRPPTLSLRRRVFDAWVGSTTQRMLKQFLVG